jgi:4'-phosphopantetheinyl transferase
VTSPQNLLGFGAIRVGPAHVGAWPYRRGDAADARVQAWLAEALGVDAAVFRLDRDARGRPHLVANSDDDVAKLREIDVNWSHSGEWLFAAYVRNARVGVDIELLRPRPKALALAERFFAPEETAGLAALADDPATMQRRFTQLWCAKEAVLKAHGRGLSFGLDKLRFALDDFALYDRADASAPRLIACDPALGTPEDWGLQGWMPQPGYWATLAWRAARANEIR